MSMRDAGIIVGGGKARTESQNVSRARGVHVLRVRRGSGKEDGRQTMVMMDGGITKGRWNFFPCYTYEGNPRFKSNHKEPGLALNYDGSGRMTVLERRHIVVFLQPDRSPDFIEFMDEFLFRAMRDSGQTDSPESRRGLISVLDAVIEEIYESNVGWHDGIRDKQHSDSEITISVGDDAASDGTGGTIIRTTNL